MDSHKSNGAGLNYEVAIHLWEDRVVWIKGPVPAKQDDIAVFRSELQTMIPEGKKVIGDLGYRGEEGIISFANSLDVELVRSFKSHAHARHETFNKMLKRYECLHQKFTHGIQKHGWCFNAVAVTCQCEAEGPDDVCTPLFSV